MPQPLAQKQVALRPEATPPLRGRRVQPPAPVPSAMRNRILTYFLALVTVVLVVDALVGDKGLLETVRAQRQYEVVAAALAAKRQENARLREEIRRLKEDPAAVEAIAREELGLIRPGEMLFIVHDVHDAGPKH
jgi:cell division protein FtsB